MTVSGATDARPTVRVWIADPEAVDDAHRVMLWRLLDDDERARADRFAFQVHRRQYVVAHALKRSMLSAMVDGRVRQGDWRFRAEPGGKPLALNEGAPFFNLSHTDGLVACAASETCELGVDVEHAARAAPLEVASDVFTDFERAQLARLPEADRASAFFRLWTLKEACIKATGDGLAASLKAFGFDLQTLQLASEPVAEDRLAEWRFAQYRATAAHVLAVAWRGAADRPRVEHATWSVRRGAYAC